MKLPILIVYMTIFGFALFFLPTPRLSLELKRS